MRHESRKAEAHVADLGDRREGQRLPIEVDVDSWVADADPVPERRIVCVVAQGVGIHTRCSDHVVHGATLLATHSQPAAPLDPSKNLAFRRRVQRHPVAVERMLAVRAVELWRAGTRKAVIRTRRKIGLRWWLYRARITWDHVLRVSGADGRRVRCGWSRR